MEEKGKFEEKPKASSFKPGSESIRHQEEDLRAFCSLALLHDGLDGMAIPDFEQSTILGLGHTVVKTRLNSYISIRVYVWTCREEEKKRGGGVSILLALEEEENQEMVLMTEPLR